MVTNSQLSVKCLSGTQGIELVREEKYLKQKLQKLNLCERKKWNKKVYNSGEEEKKDTRLKGELI